MIPKEFTTTYDLYRAFEEEINCLPPEIPAEAEVLKNNRTGNFWNYDLMTSFQEDYNYLTENKIFFLGCNFEIYNKYYYSRKQEYLKNIKDAQEIDFIINDYNSLQEDEIFYFVSENLKENIKVSIRRIKEFLDETIEKLGFKIEKNSNNKARFIYSKDSNFKITAKEPLIDLSETSAVQKIIYLEKLGILDFLRSKAKKGISINRLASILSAITGEKASTIQSAINPIGNKGANQRNNPFISNPRQVEIITNKLTDYGFDV